MWWRTPWLRQRWQLIGLALLDAGLVTLAYNALFWQRFGSWVGMTSAVLGLTLLWVGSSYLLGRYSSPEQGQRDSRRRRLLSTMLVALVVLASVVVVLSWGVKVNDPRTFRSFLIPLLAAVTISSALAQLWITNRRRMTRNWLLVGDREELEVLRGEMSQEAATDHLIFCTCEDLQSGQLPRHGDVDAIAVSETAPLDDPLLQDLLARRGNGMSICSLLLWAEQHLQRVPPELFSSRWLVQAEGFELQPGRWGWRLKRLGDVIVSMLLLVLTAPCCCWRRP